MAYASELVMKAAARAPKKLLPSTMKDNVSVAQAAAVRKIIAVNILSLGSFLCLTR